MMRRNRSARLGLTLPEIREATIQGDILTYLKWRRIPAWPTHSPRNHPETPGMADIIGVIPNLRSHAKHVHGRFLAIEVKNEEGAVSEAQREWLNRVHLCGGLAVVARSVEDVQRAIDGGV